MLINLNVFSRKILFYCGVLVIIFSAIYLNRMQSNLNRNNPIVYLDGIEINSMLNETEINSMLDKQVVCRQLHGLSLATSIIYCVSVKS